MRVAFARSLPALALIASLAPQQVLAISPTLLYSGRAIDASGDPVTGTLDVVIGIYDSAEDGALLFEESFLGANAITATDGYFTVLLQNNEAGTIALDEISA